MYFNRLPRRSSVPSATNEAFLEEDNWDDYHFKTLFHLHYRDAAGQAHRIGNVKIGHSDLNEERRRPPVPQRFEQLDDAFFSLGQDESYYDNLNKLGESTRDDIFRALNDMAFDLNLFERALEQEVTKVSLLRDVSVATVDNQFNRMSQGGARLSPFSFTYTYPVVDPWLDEKPLQLSFDVAPETQPPTNVHVVIGRNGVGKTHLLNNIATTLLESNNKEASGSIQFAAADLATTARRRPPYSKFANLISVAFSAFDEFEPLSSPRDKTKGIQYSYIGLKKIARSSISDASAPKDSKALAVEFGTSVRACLQGPRLARWRRALEKLESDPGFADVEVATLADDATDDEQLRVNARDLFRELSSGHKIVLLTITRLVETIEERSLVLLDEPESHLHPPLLSAFIRALSDLLIYRNGVAIIATHSPVVLQEVPKTCVWKLRKSGMNVAADRPQLETFGENVGILTQEVFGLEVTNSGFHRMIAKAVRQRRDYDGVLGVFNGHLGSEARALIQGLLAASNRRR